MAESDVKSALNAAVKALGSAITKTPEKPTSQNSGSNGGASSNPPAKK